MPKSNKKDKEIFEFSLPYINFAQHRGETVTKDLYAYLCGFRQSTGKNFSLVLGKSMFLD